MEAITRKRKLNEIDTNIPFNHSTISNLDLTVRDARKFIWKKLKQPKLITPTKGCENSSQFHEKEGKHTDSPKLQRNSKRDVSANKSVLRCHKKTCDRRFRKAQTYENKLLDAKLDSGLDETSERISSIKVTVEPPTRLLDENSIQTDSSKEQTTVEHPDKKGVKLLFAYDYFEEIVSYEFERESHFKLSDDYCKKFDIDPARREILIDWLITVQAHFKANNSTLHLAVSLLDILLDKIYIPCEQLQVSAIASFWVAYKYTEGNLSVKELINLCAGTHGKEIICNHEILVLKSSGFLQVGGSACTFFIYIVYKIFATGFPPEIYYCGHFFLDIMMSHFVFIRSSACERATTAAYMAIAIFDSEVRFRLFNFSRFITRKRLKILCYNLTSYLQAMYRDEEFMRSSNLFKKYKSSRYLKISVNETLRAFAG